MNVSRIIITRESLKKSDDAYYYDGYLKYKEPKKIEQLDNLIAAVLYDMACKAKKMEECQYEQTK